MIKKMLRFFVVALFLGVALNNFVSFDSHAIDNDELTVTPAALGPVVTNIGRVSNNSPDCGEVVEIFFDLENFGDAAAEGFIWRVPIDATFTPVQGSLKLNGVPISGMVGNNINVNVPSIQVGEKITYSYQVSLRNFPNNSARFVVTTATLYEADMTVHNNVLFSIYFTPLDVRMAPIEPISQVVNVGDTVDYTYDVTNNSCFPVDNYSVKTTLPPEMSIVPGSLTINGVSSPGITGNDIVASIATIPLGQTAQVKFQGVVNSMPATPDPNNTGNGLLNHTITLHDKFNVAVTSANRSLSVINNAEVSVFNKTVSQASASLNSELTYNITVKNDGLSTLSNYTLEDILPTELGFVDGSLNIDGAVQTNPTGNSIVLTLPDIAPGAIIDITYKTTINTMPSNIDRSITNSATLKDASGSIKDTRQAITIVNLPEYGIHKTANVPTATISQEVEYTIEVVNKNAFALNNYVVTDALSDYLTYVDNSLTLDGVNVDGISGQNIDITIPSIAANATTLIKYKAVVNAMPSSMDPVIPNNGLIPNTAHLLNAANEQLAQSTHNLSVDPGPADISLKSTVSKSVAQYNEVLTYTFTVTNNGFVPVTNYTLENILADELTMVDGSLTINTVVQPTPPSSLNVVIPQLNPGETFIVIYEALITAFPTNPASTIINTVVLKDETETVVSSIDNITTVNLPNVDINKLVNKSLAKVEDVLTYTIIVQNNNAYALDNYIVEDVVSESLSVNSETLMLNGTPNNSINGQTINITIPSIPANSHATITFDATIIQFPSLPDPNNVANGLISNTATLYNPLSVHVAESTVNTSVITQVFKVGIEKTVMDKTANFNTEITYMIDISNQGNATINNYTLIDTLPVELSLVPGSFEVNGVVDSSIDSNNIEFTINNLHSNDNIFIKYRALIVGFPTDPNNLVVNDAFIQDENGVLQAASQAFTQVNQPIVEILKTVNSSTASVEDVLNYTIEVKNLNDYPLNAYTVQDVLATDISYVQDTLKLNGEAIDSIVNNEINVDTIEIAANTTSYITYSAKITGFPAKVDPSNSRNGMISNTALLFNSANEKVAESTADVSVDPGLDNVSLVSNVSKAVSEFDEVLTYTFTVTNNGLIPVKNYTLENTIAPELNMIDGTYTINRIVQPNPGDTVNIVIPNLNPNETYVIVYEARIIAFPTNDNNTVINTVVLSDTDGNIVTSIDNLTVVNLPKIVINKFVNKSVAEVEDVLSYSIVVENNNSYDLHDYVVSDIVSEYLSVKNETLMLDGTPNKGISGQIINVTIPTITANTQAKITFDAKINQFPSIEDPRNIGNGLITNTATLLDASNTNVAEASVDSSVIPQVFGVRLEKTVLEQTANFNDEITYMINITNEGNATINNYTFEDQLPVELTIVPASFEINGIVDESINTNDINLTINDLGQNQVMQIKYKAKITDFPHSSNRIIVNEAIVLNENATIVAASQAITELNSPKVEINKTVDKHTLTVGDTLEYTIKVKNLNSYPINGYSVEDILAKELEYISDSLALNGEPIDGIVNNTISVNLPQIDSSASVVITYSVKIASFPDTIDPKNVKNGLISNTAILVDMYDNQVDSSTITKSVIPKPDKVQVPDQRLPVTGNDSGYKMIALYIVMASLLSIVSHKKKIN